MKNNSNDRNDHSIFYIYFRLIVMLGKDHPVSFVAYSVLMIIQGVIPAVSVQMMYVLFEEGTRFLNGEQNHLLVFLLVTISYAAIVQLIQPLIDMTVNMMLKYIQRHLVASLDFRVFTKIENVRLEHLEQADFYVKIQRARSFVTTGQFERFLRRSSISLRHLLTVSSIAGVAFAISPWLGLCCLFAAIPISILRFVRGKKFYELTWFQSPRQRVLDYFAQVLIARNEAKELRAFQLTDYFLNRWRRLRDELRDERWVFERKNIKLELLSSTLTVEAITYGLSIIVTVYAVLRGELDVPGFAATLVAIQHFQLAFRTLLVNLSQSVGEGGYLADLYCFLDTAEEETTKETQKLPVPLQQGIQVEGLSFTYPGSQTPALHHISFHISPGEKIAIVGENGAGKTTLVKLLLGLYQPTEGRISYDGIPLHSLDLTSFRANLSVVMQDFMRYQYKVKENIGFGEISLLDDEERIQLAAEKGGADTFISALPEQFETRLGKEFPQSIDLSGGQWQRLATARGFMRSPQLLVLDEPTAALDPLQEAEVYQRFIQMSEGKMTVVVSHRMASCRLVDRIFVIHGHRLAEVGTHQQLMELDGLYADMYRKQAQWYQR